MARLLVVDDDKDILKFAESILVESNYEVQTAENAIKAMDLLNSIHFDAVITDANMPQYTGFELIQTIKNNPRFKNMSVTMLTGRRDKESIEKALRMGVDDYIVKPLDPMIFLKKIGGLFDKKPQVTTPEVKFPEATTNSRGSIAHDIVVKSISESGILIESQYALVEGNKIKIDCHLFQQIGVQPNYLKILTTREKNDAFESRLSFMGMKDSELEKIRRWVFTKTSKKVS